MAIPTKSIAIFVKQIMREEKCKLTLGIVIPILILTAPKTYALTHEERFNFGFSDGGQQATTDFLNHSPFNSACDPTGAHTGHGCDSTNPNYCFGYLTGYDRTFPHHTNESEIWLQANSSGAMNGGGQSAPAPICCSYSYD